MVTKCDRQLGAGLIFNASAGAANKLCDLQDGKRYIMSGQPDMLGAFECIAKVGTSGGAAAMGDAMIAALSPKLNGPGGCNEGFLREDALLVVALITDFHDETSKTYTKAQYEALIAAKGDPDAVVMLAVVPNAAREFEPAEKCDYEGGDSFGIFEELLSKFPYKVFGDTCTPSSRRSSTKPRTRSARRAGASSRSDLAGQTSRRGSLPADPRDASLSLAVDGDVADREDAIEAVAGDAEGLGGTDAGYQCWNRTAPGGSTMRPNT